MLNQMLMEAAENCAKELAEKLHNGEIEVSHNDFGENCIIVEVGETAIQEMPADSDAQMEVLNEIKDVFYRRLRDLSGHCSCPKKRGVLLAGDNIVIILPGCCGHCATE